MAVFFVKSPIHFENRDCVFWVSVNLVTRRMVHSTFFGVVPVVGLVLERREAEGADKEAGEVLVLWRVGTPVPSPAFILPNLYRLNEPNGSHPLMGLHFLFLHAPVLRSLLAFKLAQVRLRRALHLPEEFTVEPLIVPAVKWLVVHVVLITLSRSSPALRLVQLVGQSDRDDASRVPVV